MSDNVEHKTLAEAFTAAQAEFPAVDRDGTNPHFRSSFTTLGHLLGKVRPVLNRHGLSVIQLPCRDADGAPVLRTILMHTSGQQIAAEAPLLLVKQDPQGQGSAITYMRRYALAAALGISDQDDDDGNAGSQNGNAIDKARAERIVAAFHDRKLNYQAIDMLLGSAGLDALRAKSAKAVRERIDSLSPEQADAVEAELG